VRELRQLKAEIFQALGHPTRLAILEALQDRELAVGAILSRLGMEQGNVSQHLAILRSRRLVSTRKDGNRVFYSLRDPILGRVLADMLLRKMGDGREPRARPARRRPGRTK